MSKQQLTPEFKVNGQTYTIKRTRDLLVKYDKAVKDLPVDEKDAFKFDLFNDLLKESSEIAERYENAKKEYFDDILNTDKKAMYREFKELNTEKLAEVNSKQEELDTLLGLNKQRLDLYEKLIIDALALQHDMSPEKAKSVWEEFGTEVGSAQLSQWVMAIGEELFAPTEVEDNSFLARKQAEMRIRAENLQKARRK